MYIFTVPTLRLLVETANASYDHEHTQLQLTLVKVWLDIYLFLLSKRNTGFVNQQLRVKA